jgi:hypothetical protein
MGTDQDNTVALLQAMLIDKQQPRLEEAIQLVLADRQALEQVLAGIIAKDDTYRYNCFKVLHQIAEEQPQAIYPAWDDFVELLDSDNAYHRSMGAQLIATLACADTDHRFETIFDRTFALLDDEKIVPARQFAQQVGRIARANPHLQSRITEQLLAVEDTHHTEGRKDLLKGDVIGVFDEFFADSPNQERILAFVRRQLTCSSPSTRKAARAFVERHGRGKKDEHPTNERGSRQAL